MKIIGLTGGIASGKSTVARILAEAGVPVIDADQVAREVVEPGREVHARIAARWPQVIREDRTLDRKRLGEIVFSDAVARAELSQMAMPEIRRVFLERATKLREAGHELCVFEAATLFEENMETAVDGVLCVSLSPEEQVHRLMARNGLTEAEARARLAAQLPLSEKVSRSRWVLENAGPAAGLADKVHALWEKIRREALSGGEAP
jgi:dephospho-CoA kinase